MTFLRQLVLVFLSIFVILMIYMYLIQRRLIYFPSQVIPQLGDYQATDMKVVTLRTKDGLKLHSWYKPARAGQPTLLYLHGNAGDISGRMPLARRLMDAGLGMLLLEYRGYGGNKGYPTEKGLYEDARAGLRFLHEQGIQSKDIVVYGESLGSGVALAIATETSFCAIVLQSPYTSLSELARFHYPWVLIKPKDRFDSSEKIRSVHAPLLILHGLRDEIVPYFLGETLFQKANEPKKMLSFSEGHNDLWDAPNFSKNVLEFINRYCVNYSIVRSN